MRGMRWSFVQATVRTGVASLWFVTVGGGDKGCVLFNLTLLLLLLKCDILEPVRVRSGHVFRLVEKYWRHCSHMGGINFGESKFPTS